MTEKYEITTPVLLILFNRPDCVKEVFGAIRDSRPRKLYVFADGPRYDHEEDNALCNQARLETEDVDWDCEVHRFYSDVNLGCGVGPYTGMDWVFKNEDRAIILEDDCVPNHSFFRFCQELLAKYEAEPRVMTISGLNFDIQSESRFDYYFTHYNNTFGWATWKRVWNLYDYDMHEFEGYRETNALQKIVLYRKNVSYWNSVFEKIVTGEEKTAWDAQFMFMSFQQNGLHVFPQKNMVKCIGFGDDATHTKNIDSKARIVYGTQCSYEISFPLKHPDEIREDFRSDCVLMQDIYGVQVDDEFVLDETIKKAISDSENLILYGAGKKCDKIITELHKNGIDKFFVATTNEENTFVMGNKVHVITELVDLKDALVIITVKKESAIKEIKDNLTRLGFKKIMAVY